MLTSEMLLCCFVQLRGYQTHYVEEAAGTHLYRAGEGAYSKGYLLVEGLCRAYDLLLDGREVTNCIQWELGEPLMPSADLTQSPSSNVVTVTPSYLIEFDMGWFLELARSDIRFATLAMRLTQKAWNLHFNHQRALQEYDNQGRYQWFLREYPGVIDRMPHYHIATFLQMSPVTLSRVRGRITSPE